LVTADWEGISRVISFKDWTYLIWSIKGRRMFKPEERVL